jgi:hypothetical protein
MRKLITLLAVIGAWAASPASALAAPTLTLSGTCAREDFFFPDIGAFPALVYQVSAVGSGFRPNNVLPFLLTESASPVQNFNSFQTDATGAFARSDFHLHAIALFLNPPASITFTMTMWDDVDRDQEFDPGEAVLATDSVTVVCPPPRRCDEIVPQAEASGALRHGEARSLTAKCDSAEASASSGHTKAARNKLKAFIHEVRAMLRSRRISCALGQELIDSANARIASLP